MWAKSRIFLSMSAAETYHLSTPVLLAIQLLSFSSKTLRYFTRLMGNSLHIFIAVPSTQSGNYEYAAQTELVRESSNPSFLQSLLVDHYEFYDRELKICVFDAKEPSDAHATPSHEDALGEVNVFMYQVLPSVCDH
jgi:hypothetical protein